MVSAGTEPIYVTPPCESRRSFRRCCEPVWVLILKRNATRDYLDFVALAALMGDERVVSALYDFDRLYPQPNDESALQQLQIQSANPLPYDLEETHLAEYKNLDARWHDWKVVTAFCVDCATLIFDRICGLKEPNEPNVHNV